MGDAGDADTAGRVGRRVDKEVARLEARLDSHRLVKQAVAEDPGIRQWVKTASISRKQLAQLINRQALDDAAVEELAPVVNGFDEVRALEERGVRPLPPLLRLLPKKRKQRREEFEDELDVAYGQLSAAQAKLQDMMVEAVKRQLRSQANLNRSDLFGTRLPPLEHQGLAETDQAGALAMTSARRRLGRLVRDMPGGSIGLAGPRGAGKSTLIRASCSRTEKAIFGVVVSAPVDFDPREFILHLFSEVCQTVLGRDEVETLRRPGPFGPRGDRPWLANQIAMLAARFAIFIGVLLVAISTLPGLPALAPETISGLALVGAGVTGLLASRYATKWRSSFVQLRLLDESRGDLFSRRALELARRGLQDIWFQQTFTTGWAGSLKLPLGLEGGLTGGHELARQQRGMPDIVAELRELIEEIARPAGSDPGKAVRSVRIGIDELDKIDSPHDARRFMNEIKILFGIPNCFFFVSVSEDAMSDFERRGLPFRDVFDSSFDDIVRVGYLDVATTIDLVQGRVIGMPIPFILLGHCLAGGLARDVIRVARDIVALAPRGSGFRPRLAEVCNTLVGKDVNGKAGASAQACKRLSQTEESERLQAWFWLVRAKPIAAESLMERCESAEAELRFLRGRQASDGETRIPVDLATEYLAFCYFAATLMAYFSEERQPESFESAVPRKGGSQLDQLAEARQAFATSPQAAWNAISSFRAENDLGANPEFPVFGKS